MYGVLMYFKKNSKLYKGEVFYLNFSNFFNKLDPKTLQKSIGQLSMLLNSEEGKALYSKLSTIDKNQLLEILNKLDKDNMLDKINDINPSDIAKKIENNKDSLTDNSEIFKKLNDILDENKGG